jgi:hypothetical protein
MLTGTTATSVATGTKVDIRSSDMLRLDWKSVPVNLVLTPRYKAGIGISVHVMKKGGWMVIGT